MEEYIGDMYKDEDGEDGGGEHLDFLRRFQ